MKLSEAVAKVIKLAQAIGRYWQTELPKRHPHYPVMGPGEETPPPPPDEKKLTELLTALPENQLYQIALLMYLGRGDFDAIHLADHYELLRQEFPDTSSLTSLLTGKATLAEYLDDALSEVRKHQIDLDSLPLRDEAPGLDVRIRDRRSGRVIRVVDTHVVVAYQTPEGRVEHVYDQSQFIDGRLPNEGDFVEAHAFVAFRPPRPEEFRAGDESNSPPADEFRAFRERRKTGPVVVRARDD